MRHVKLLEGDEMLHQKKIPSLSALVKDVTSFFSWGCREICGFFLVEKCVFPLGKAERLLG